MTIVTNTPVETKNFIIIPETPPWPFPCQPLPATRSSHRFGFYLHRFVSLLVLNFVTLPLGIAFPLLSKRYDNIILLSMFETFHNKKVGFFF